MSLKTDSSLNLSSSDLEARPSRSRKVRWALIALLIWSVGLRVWYALPELNANRFWDERYGLENIEALVLEGTIKPANGYHPSLSYLPQALLLGASQKVYEITGWKAAQTFAKRRPTPTAYLLCRLSQVVLGGLSLWVMFLLGRRLLSPEAGVAAAFLLSVTPWHIRQSTIYKPDILLLLLVELCLLLALRALEVPSLRRYLLAGGGVGLALAAKFNGGPAALPLAIPTLRYFFRDRRRWLWLIAAGATAVGVFLLLDPFVLIDPDLYRRDFSRTLRDYARKGATEGAGRAYLLLHAAKSLVHENFHGPWVGTLGLLALALLVVRQFRLPASSPERSRWLAFLSFPVGYTGFYALTTTNPSAHNWLLLLPFTSLAAVWLVATAVARWWPERVRRALPVAAALVVFALAVPAQRYVYRSVVPTTMELASGQLRQALDPLAGRFILFEEGLEWPVLHRPHGERAASLPVSRWDSLDEDRRVLADGEIFRWLPETAGEGFPGTRWAATWFRARGPAVGVVPHAWKLLERREVVQERPAPEARRTHLWVLEPPALAGVEAFSLELWIPGLPSRAAKSVILKVDGRPVEVFGLGRGRLLLPRRWLPSQAITLEADWQAVPARCRRLQVTAFWWQAPDRPSVPAPSSAGDGSRVAP
jgi:hypothetical protein